MKINHNEQVLEAEAKFWSTKLMILEEALRGNSKYLPDNLNKLTLYAIELNKASEARLAEIEKERGKIKGVGKK